jgi:hypothetical protein
MDASSTGATRSQRFEKTNQQKKYAQFVPLSALSRGCMDMKSIICGVSFLMSDFEQRLLVAPVDTA